MRSKTPLNKNILLILQIIGLFIFPSAHYHSHSFHHSYSFGVFCLLCAVCLFFVVVLFYCSTLSNPCWLPSSPTPIQIKLHYCTITFITTNLHKIEKLISQMSRTMNLMLSSNVINFFSYAWTTRKPAITKSKPSIHTFLESTETTVVPSAEGTTQWTPAEHAFAAIWSLAAATG